MNVNVLKEEIKELLNIDFREYYFDNFETTKENDICCILQNDYIIISFHEHVENNTIGISFNEYCSSTVVSCLTQKLVLKYGSNVTIYKGWMIDDLGRIVFKNEEDKFELDATIKSEYLN